MKTSFTFSIILIALALVAGVMTGSAETGALLFGAAATVPLVTETREGKRFTYSVKGSTTIYAGSLVSLDANNYAIPAADTASTTVVGIAMETVDNSAGSDGDLTIDVERSCCKLANDASETLDTVGETAVVLDSATVTKAAGATNDITAGIVRAIDSDGVWIQI